MDETAAAASRQLEIRKANAPQASIRAAWKPESVDIEARTAEVIWTTGSDVERADLWTGQRYVERLIVSAETVNLDRLVGGPLLDSHDRGSVERQRGVIEDAWLAGGVGVARVRFATDESSDQLFQKVAEGVARQLSCGYRIDQVRITENADGPALHEATRWTPFEISVVPIGADAGAQVRSYQASAAVGEVREEVMSEVQEGNAVPGPTPIKAERERTGWITEHCRKFNLGDAFERKLVDEGLPIEQCRVRLFDALAERDMETHTQNQIEPGSGRREADFVEVAAEAVLHRTGVKRTENQDALALAQRDFLEAVGRTACSMEGRNVPPTASRATLAERAIATSTLPAVVELVAHRSAQVGYGAAPPSFKQFASMKRASSYQPIQRVKLSDAPELEDVLEGADYPTGTLTDRVEISGLVKGGKILEFTEEMLMADDLGVLTDAPRMLGLAAARREADLFWQVLIGNSALSDTRDIFNATDGNQAVGAPSAATFLAARQHLFAQTTENGGPLGLEPEWIVCGGDLRDDVERLLAPSTSYSTSTSADVLPESFKQRATLIVEPRVPTDVVWFFSANTQVEHMEYYLLDGTNGPYVRREEGFSNDTIRLKVTSPFQAACLDRRGAYRLTGS